MTTLKKGPVRESGVCRCCGAVRRCRLLSAQYEFEGRPEVYSDIFLDCFGLLLSNHDGNLENCLICATCVTRLRNAQSFKLQVLMLEEKLFQSIMHIKTEIKNEDMQCNETNNDEDVNLLDNNRCNIVSESKKIYKSQTHSYINPIESENEAKDDLIREMQVTKELIWKLQQNKAQTETIDQPSTNMKVPAFTEIPSLKKPPDVVRMLQIEKADAKASKNTETLVEYSYVCPFENIFSDFICVYCREVFSVSEELFLHTAQHDPATYKLKRNKNKLTLIDINRIDCRLCDLKIDTIEQFKTHITMVHKKVYHPVKDSFIKFKLNRNSLQCVDCSSVFNFFFVLKRHMADHYGNHLCDLCGMHFFTDGQLKRHSERTHTNKPCKCSECNQTCKNVDYLKAHINRAHRKAEVFECARCNLKFLTLTEKSRHVASVHSKGRTFKCTKCGSTFKDICIWREHKRLHAKNLKIQQTRALSKDDSYLCPQCPKICLNKQGLRMHLKRIHGD